MNLQHMPKYLRLLKSLPFLGQIIYNYPFKIKFNEY